MSSNLGIFLNTLQNFQKPILPLLHELLTSRIHNPPPLPPGEPREIYISRPVLLPHRKPPSQTILDQPIPYDTTPGVQVGPEPTPSPVLPIQSPSLLPKDAYKIMQKWLAGPQNSIPLTNPNLGRTEFMSALRNALMPTRVAAARSAPYLHITTAVPWIPSVIP